MGNVLTWSVVLVVLWASGILVLFAVGHGLSSATMSWLDKSDPNDADASGTSRLRSAYRWLINIAGVYYYISLPVVIVLLLLIVGAILYGILALGRIPIKLALVLVVGALITIYSMLKSVFVRVSDEDAGRSLSESEAPGMWRVARDVAAQVGTRPVDDIRVTVGTDLAVYEKGSVSERMRDTGRRVLLVGAANFNDFRLNDFRAVLAHEYGHFQNRDTAGGDVALRVRMSMGKLAEAMIANEQATAWNIGFQFLRLYHFIFVRITHGATRLQEILADRTAVRLFGADAFARGLRHVIHRSVEFDMLASLEVENAIRERRALQNLYVRPELDGTEEAKTIAKLVEEEINRPTTPSDTHPSPGHRIALAQRIRCDRPPAEDGEVWDLIANREALSDELTELVASNVRQAMTGG